MTEHDQLSWVVKRLHTLQESAHVMGFDRLYQELGYLRSTIQKTQRAILKSHGDLIDAKVADAALSSRTTLAAALAGAGGPKTLVEAILEDCDQPVSERG